MARRSITEVATGAAILLAAGGFLAYAVANGGRGGSTEGYRLSATFDHIDGLAVGSDVRMAGVRVGRVLSTEIDPRTYLAVVGLSIRNAIALPRDTSAEITSESLLGGKFLNLSPGGDPTTLHDGQAITITQGSVSLEQLLGKFIFSVTNMNAAKAAAPAANPPATPAPADK